MVGEATEADRSGSVALGVAVGGLEEWQSTIAIVKPATVIGWHRQGFPDAEYLSDGISETLMTQLSRLPRLKVKSRDSVFRYKGKDVPDSGPRLGCPRRIEGARREAGG